ncbi:MAG: AAA family ATPase [Alphaproteobacteria bacterium]|nr:AAA family ATPase [Alphaproteobacteria bacterium]
MNAKIISLVGMSNIGKTHWTKRLAAERGYVPLDCDALIAQKLKSELKRHDVYGLAEWMGHPYDDRYAETSARYRTYEKEVMNDVFALVAAQPGQPFILDTTGSVIYTGDDLLQKLRDRTRVIYFESSPAHLEDLFRRFAKSPKPLIWDGAYIPREGESRHQSLKRCYADLLARRDAQYRALAHIVIPYDDHRAANADIGPYIEKVLS